MSELLEEMPLMIDLTCRIPGVTPAMSGELQQARFVHAELVTRLAQGISMETEEE